MTLPSLTDGSLGQQYDCAINGVGLRVLWAEAKALEFSYSPYTETDSDLVIEKQDFTNNEISDNLVDTLAWESDRSWHQGAGQLRHDDPQNSQPAAFYMNSGVDVTTPGQARLSLDTVTVTGVSNAEDLIILNVGGVQTAYASNAAGTTPATVYKMPLPASDGGSFTVTTVPLSVNGGSQALASDGSNLLAATGSTVQAVVPSSGAASTWLSGGITNGPGFLAIISMAWAKGRLVGCSVNGAQACLFQAGPTSGTTAQAIGIASGALATLAPGESVPNGAIGEMLGFVLFGVQAPATLSSRVLAWDGTTNPYTVAMLPPGDVLTSLSTFLGQEVVITALRPNSLGGYQGVLYVGQMAGAGQLQLSEVLVIGGPNALPTTLDPTLYSTVQPIWSSATAGHFTYFNWGTLGVGAYDHANQAVSLVMAGASPNLNFNSVVRVSSGSRILLGNEFGSGSSTITVQNLTHYVGSGTLTGSVMDWNIDKPKSIIQAEMGVQPLPAGTSALFAHVINGVVTGPDITLSATGATQGATSNTPAAPYAFQTGTLQYQVTLVADSTKTLSPTLKKAGFGAWYAAKPQPEWKVAIDVSDRQVGRNGAPLVVQGASPTPLVGPAPTSGQQILDMLRTLWSTQTVCLWQPPGAGAFEVDQHVFVVQIRSIVVYRWYEPGSGFGSAAFVDIKALP